MIVVKDKSLSDIGILENAYNIGTNRLVNELWTASFTLPISDTKNSLCTHLNYIEIISDTGRYYGLYRIMPTETIKGSDDESITYACEHVFATLLDDVIDGYIQLSGMSTRETLQTILNRQSVANWVLDAVDFAHNYEYSFENENGLLAPILSVPKAFNEGYSFSFDTTVYPWKLSLLSASDVVKSEILWGKDMGSFDKVSDPTDIVNYIIPKGVGEGKNQLTIARANGGLNYLKDDESIALWGKRSYIWIDTSIEDAYTLKGRGQTLLNQLKDPTISFSISAADLSVLPEYAHERRALNSVTRIIVGDDEYTARIIGEKISDLSREYDVEYVINNKVSDLATTTTDLERKVSVSTAYSQGATNIVNYAYKENCDTAHPASIPIYIDEDVVNVNTCELTFTTEKYRGYTFTGGVLDKTVTSTSATIDSTPNTHGHSVIIPGHNHTVSLGIIEFETLPTSVTVKVDGNVVPHTALTGDRINLVSYMSNNDGVISRGRHEISITPIGTPKGVARIEAYIVLRVFIQSRLGGTF